MMILRRPLMMTMNILHTIPSIHAENRTPVPLLAKIVSSSSSSSSAAAPSPTTTKNDDDSINLKAHQQQPQEELPAHLKRSFKTGVIYLHGFPDMSVNPATGEFASRVPRKLCDAVTSKLGGDDSAVFVCFNFSGLPGSSSGGSAVSSSSSDEIDTTTPMGFQSKTISKEVKDAESVIKYVIDELLVPSSSSSSVHVVGISTGAIISSLLRNKDFGDNNTKITLTCIAGLLNIKEGAKLDFNPSQIDDFETKGYCLKEFWIPPGCTIPEDAIVEQIPENPTTQSSKVLLKLNKEYYEEMIDASDEPVLDIQSSVTTNTGNNNNYPLLVIHGTNDVHVPIQNGLELYEIASEPKSYFQIEKATHLLSNTKHMNKAMNRIIQFIQENS